MPLAPCVDISLHIRVRLTRIVQVMRDRAATACLVGFDERNTELVEYPRRGMVDRRGHRRLHTTVEHQHLARVPWLRPHTFIAPGCYVLGDATRQQRLHGTPESQACGKQGCFWQRIFQNRTRELIDRPARHFVLPHLAADIDKASILHARRTS